MKHSSLITIATAAFTIAMAFSAQSSYAVSPTNPCGRVDVRCRNNYKLACVESDWICELEGTTPSSTCIASCPDGFQYPTCNPSNARELYFATDPCKNHKAPITSSASTSCNAVSPLKCGKGTAAGCVSGTWACVTPSRSTPEGNVVLNTITPSQASAGKNVLIEGKGFAPRNNIVIFADSVIPNVGSADGKHMSFRIPAHTIRPCYLTKKAPCTAPIHTYKSGTYAISVQSGTDISNILTIRISTR